MEADEGESLDLIGRGRNQPRNAAASTSGKVPIASMPADPGPVSLWLATEERWGAFKGKAMLMQDLERLMERAKDKGEDKVCIKDKKGTRWEYESVETALKLIGAQARRGVRMTTAARKPQQKTWQEIDEDDGADGADEEAKMRASRQEWDALAREVNMKKTIEAIASGRRSSVVAYDDVADEEEEDVGRDPAQRRMPLAAADDAAALGPGSPGADADDAGTAEEVVQGPVRQQDGERAAMLEDGDEGGGARQGKRGGKRKPGSQKRREAAERDEDGQPRKKRREEEDDERWMKLKLEGEEKPKRIDSTRLVSYYDFDSKTVATVVLSAVPTSSENVAVPPDFRACVVNLWADDDEEKE